MTAWTLEHHDGVAVLTFRREPANWMDLVSMGELADHLAALAEQTDEVRVVMLTGGLDGYFIAHADLDDLAALGQGRADRGRPVLLGAGARTCSSPCRSPRSPPSTARRGAAGARPRWPARCASARSAPTSASPRSWSASSPAPAARSGSRGWSAAGAAPSCASAGASWAPRRRTASAC